MAIGDHNKYLPIRLEIIRIRRYNKRYIAPADAGEAWKKGRNMKKSIRGILLLAACTVFFAGCARSKGSWEAFTENTLYVAMEAFPGLLSKASGKAITKKRS